jgi:riboflavin kinase/FMN adenylyltransferase
MGIFYGLDGVEVIKKPVVTIGTFDGVHLGHQKIIENLIEKAQKVGGESVLFTFSPHPRMVLFPDSHNLQLIQTQHEKLKKLEKTGIDHIVIFPFTFDFSRLTAMEFVRDILVNKLNIHTIVIGYDHQFGRNREGNIQYLKDVSATYDFEAIEIPAKEIDDVNVSSTKIRKAILSGDIELANQYLGSPFTLQGVVHEGRKLGRQLGFPTANIQVNEGTKILPGNGVYIVEITHKNRLYKGVMNVGFRPTVEQSAPIQIEIHIFDFQQEIYGEELEVAVLRKIRNEIKFENLEELSNQIKKDIAFTRDYFTKFSS